jgi:TPR repeat protein
LFWYRHAAKFNHKEALWNLALKYQKGDGVEVNYKKAFSFYKKAAELGDAPRNASWLLPISKVFGQSRTSGRVYSGCESRRAREIQVPNTI